MKTALALLCLTAASQAFAAAEVVDIAWTPEGQFTHATMLAPKQVLEVCGKLPKGSRVHWSFEAGTPLPFNIHVHQGKEVVFLAKLEQAEKASGLQTFDAEPAHCWMWTNKGAQVVQLSVGLQQHR